MPAFGAVMMLVFAGPIQRLLESADREQAAIKTL